MGFIVAMGIVSLFSDAAYEGARAIIGAYMAQLGAAAAIVGLVAGGGELLGYLVRLISGPAADRTRKYWLFTGVGYLVNLASIPAMGLARSWPQLAGLVFSERTGKAIRTPARDAMLSHAAERIGPGWGFGIHEALDQIGAVAGPLLVALALSLGAGYATGFLWLSVPVALALTTLLVAVILFPRPETGARTAEIGVAVEEPPSPSDASEGDGPKGHSMRTLLRGDFGLYLTAVAFAGAGLADFALVAFHAERQGMVSSPSIPVIFALAMGVDGLSALGFGRLFDRIGLGALSLGALVSAPFSVAAFSSSGFWLVIGVLVWGIGLGAQESIMRSGVAVLVPPDMRGSGYGLLGAVFGVSWFLGSAAMGVLYEVNRLALVAFSVACESIAAVVLAALWARRREAKRNPAGTA